MTDNTAPKSAPANTPAKDRLVPQSGIDVIENALATALRANPNDAPFGMPPEEAAIWHAGRAQAFQHVLEMLNIPAPK